MSKLFFSLLFAVVAINARAGNPDNEATLKVKTSESTVEWTARKVTGQHQGTVAIKEGSLQIKDGLLKGGTFTIDMTSINVTDLEGKSKATLEGHLKSEDFFGVETYPTATFVITEAKSTGNGQYDINADLTIKGITNPVEFTATVKPEGKVYKAIAEIKIDRTLFNVRYGSGKFFEGLGDKAIYDEFDLSVSLVTEE